MFSFVYFCLCWIFVAVHGLPPVTEEGSYSLVVVGGLLIAVASLVAEHRLRCPAECGIFADQGSNACPLHWLMDS